MALELALLTVPLVVIMVFIAALGRFSAARNQVDEAARDAARQASTYLSPTLAAQQGGQIAREELSGVCANPAISIDTADLRPGGQVSATVSCHVALGDLSLLRLPGDRNVAATSTSVIDSYVAGP